VIAHYGFMQRPNIPWLVSRLREELGIDGGAESGEEPHVTYYIGRERPVPVGGLGMNRLRARVFEFLSRVAPRPEERFLLPRDEVVEIGIQIGV